MLGCWGAGTTSVAKLCQVWQSKGFRWFGSLQTGPYSTLGPSLLAPSMAPLGTQPSTGSSSVTADQCKSFIAHGRGAMTSKFFSSPIWWRGATKPLSNTPLAVRPSLQSWAPARASALAPPCTLYSWAGTPPLSNLLAPPAQALLIQRLEICLMTSGALMTLVGPM